MSLDLYLEAKTPQPRSGTGVFIREDGSSRELTEAEVAERFPNYEPFKVEYEDDATHDIWWRNITHNISPMWSEAGCYEALYESDGQAAATVVYDCVKAVDDMRANPAKYQALNPPNGWGDYEGALAFLESFVQACRECPDAIIRVSA